VYPHTKLDGTPQNTSDVAEEAGDSVGPSAMAAGDQTWTNTIWNYLATNPFGDHYFGETIKMIVYIVMAGDYWSPVADGPKPTTYEAEAATLSQAVVATNHTGFTGTGFADYNAVTGGFVEWKVNSTAGGSATLTFRYSNGSTAGRPMAIAVNGNTVNPSLAFGTTTNWDTWKTATITVTLNAGSNTVRATSTTTTGGPNVDNLVVS
jgi:hypothetical protein